MAEGYAHYPQPVASFPSYHTQRRRPTPPETPSPSRSPASQSPGATYFYNSGQTLPHSMMNRTTFIQQGVPKYAFAPGFSAQQVDGLVHMQGLSASASNGSHQHNFASSLGGSNFPSPQHGTTTLVNQKQPHWKEQQELLAVSRSASEPHHHARQAAILNKNSSAAVTVSGGVNPNSYQPTNAQHRKDGPTAEEAERLGKDGKVQRQDWTSLDLGGQGLKAVSKALFDYTFLDKLYLNHNKLKRLPAAIGKLKLLQHLDISSNELTELPPELGMLTNLRQLLVFDNQLATLPFELGTLYQLEIMGIEGNPLQEDMKSLLMEQGTKALIVSLRDAPPPSTFVDQPPARNWVILDEKPESAETQPASDKFQVMSYNILCEKYATPQMYGYTASWALSWEFRKSCIKNELVQNAPDIICLQEIDQDNFSEFFAPELALMGYKGVFKPKTRSKTMNDVERKSVDGCAIFYQSNRYKLLDKHVIEFNQSAIAREDFKATPDVFNRVMPRDDVAVILFLENKETGSRLIVANAHVYWDPRSADVKLVQVAILMDEVTRLSNSWVKTPRTQKPDSDEPASPEYTEITQIPLIVCGDFNSNGDSSVYELLSKGQINSSHTDLVGRTYGTLTRDGITHPFSLKSSYANIGELKFTNYTADFTGVLDYIWYSTNSMTVTGLLGDIDPEYIATVPGFPNAHHPSDHIPLLAEFEIKPRKDHINKPPPPDFGGGGGGSRAR